MRYEITDTQQKVAETVREAIWKYRRNLPWEPVYAALK